MIELYQFPISHYCEKARWALDFKSLEHVKRNLLPGFHVKKTIKLAGKSAVPVLMDQGVAIKNSADIISYLDDKYPDITLTPADAALQAEAMEWERYADREIGPYVRCLCYNTLLDHPDIVIPIFTGGGPWYGKPLLKVIYPKLQAKMRKFMKINDETAQKSKERLDIAIDHIHNERGNSGFMVGQEFTRADLAIAALLAPLCMPDGYGLDWPEVYPSPLKEIVTPWSGKLDWVHEIYAKYR